MYHRAIETSEDVLRIYDKSYVGCSHWGVHERQYDHFCSYQQCEAWYVDLTLQDCLN